MAHIAAFLLLMYTLAWFRPVGIRSTAIIGAIAAFSVLSYALQGGSGTALLLLLSSILYWAGGRYLVSRFETQHAMAVLGLWAIAIATVAFIGILVWIQTPESLSHWIHLSPASDGSIVRRLRGPFIGPNVFGMVLATAAVIGIGTAKKSYGSIAIVLLFFLVSAAVVLTGSRATVVGLIVGSAVVLAIRGVLSWRIVLVGMGLVIVITGTLIALRPDALDGLAGRTDIWRLAVPQILERPLLGYGIDTKVEGVTITRGLASLEPYTDTASFTAHNVFLQIALDSGVVPMVLMAISTGMSLMVIRHAWIRLQDPGQRQVVAIGGGVLMVALSGMMLTSIPLTMQWVWLFLGWMSAVGRSSGSAFVQVATTVAGHDTGQPA